MGSLSTDRQAGCVRAARETLEMEGKIDTCIQERGEGRKNQAESTEYGEIVGFNSEKGKGFKKAWKR